MLLRQGGTTFDANPRHSRLRPFLHRDFDGQLRGIALIAANQFAGNFRLPEAARAIELFFPRVEETPEDRPSKLLHVVVSADQQHFAVTSVAEQSPGRLILHARTNQFVGEKAVALDANGRQFMAIPGIDVVHHLQAFSILRVMLMHCHRNFEVPQSLHVVLDVAPPLIEQIIIDRAFFVDRHQPPKNALAQFETFRSNRDRRAAIHLEHVVHGVARRLVGATCDRDLRQQSVLLLVARPNALQRTGRPAR